MLLQGGGKPLSAKQLLIVSCCDRKIYAMMTLLLQKQPFFVPIPTIKSSWKWNTNQVYTGPRCAKDGLKRRPQVPRIILKVVLFLHAAGAEKTIFHLILPNLSLAHP